MMTMEVVMMLTVMQGDDYSECDDDGDDCYAGGDDGEHGGARRGGRGAGAGGEGGVRDQVRGYSQGQASALPSSLVPTTPSAPEQSRFRPRGHSVLSCCCSCPDPYIFYSEYCQVYFLK